MLRRVEVIFDDETLGKTFTEMPVPEAYRERVEAARHEVIEAAVEHDEELLEKYLGGAELTLRRDPARHPEGHDVRRRSCRCCAAPRSRTRACRRCSTPSSTTCRARWTSRRSRGTCPLHDDTHVERCASDASRSAALAFKIATDPYVGRLTFFRVYSGVAQDAAATSTTAPRTSGSGSAACCRCTPTSGTRSRRCSPATSRAAIGLKDTRTGDTLCDEDKPIILEAMKFPNPVIDVAIEPKTKADQDKLATALQKLQEEDPDVPGADRRGDGPDDHRRHGRAAPRDPRRPHEARVQGRGQRRQAAGGVPGDDPAEGRRTSRASSSGRAAARASTATWSSTSSRPSRATGFIFEDKIVGGVIPREFIKPVEAGIREALENGVLAGYPMVDVKATLIDGSYHDVDSSEMAFKIAGSMAVKEAARAGAARPPRAGHGGRGGDARPTSWATSSATSPAAAARSAA